MGGDMNLTSSDINFLRQQIARSIQEQYNVAADRLGNGYVPPHFISGFYDRAADSVVIEAAKFIERRTERRYDCAYDSLAQENANLAAGHSGIDILGLREQITDNLKTLVPYLKAKKNIHSDGAKDAVFAVNPEVHIVTIGQEPAVRACVFSSGAAQPKKLIHSDQASDATGALHSLLKKTQSMLATQFSKTSAASTKVASGVTDFTSSAVTKVGGSKIASRAAPKCETAASKVTSSKVKSEAKVKHARTKSTTRLWDSSSINNTSFHESCGEPVSEGGDSGFLSRDGEAHPNRSYNDLQALAAIPASIQHAKILAEVVPKATVPEETKSVSDKFF